MGDASTVDLRKGDGHVGTGSMTDDATRTAGEVPEPRRAPSTTTDVPTGSAPSTPRNGPAVTAGPAERPGPPAQPAPAAFRQGPMSGTRPGAPTHPGHPFGPGAPVGPPGRPWPIPYPVPAGAGAPPPPWPPFGPPPVQTFLRARRKVWPALVLALACLAGGATAGAVAGNAAAAPPAAAAEGSVSDAAAAVLPSTVTILGDDDSSGSGVVLSADGPNGTILTNAHVLDGPSRLQAVFADGQVAPLEIVGTARRADIGLVRFSGVSGVRPAQLGDSHSLRKGDTVIAIGEPFGLTGSVTRGIVSATGRPFPGERPPDVLDTIQTDAAINHGNSGGPLVDLSGRVVGINSLSIGADPQEPAESLGFAIPIEHANRVAGELATTGHATLATLQATVRDLAAPGARVTAVTAGSGAEAAGLRAGDVITRYGNQPITMAGDLLAAVQSSVPGSTVDVVVTGADGTSRTVPVVLGTTAA